MAVIAARMTRTKQDVVSEIIVSRGHENHVQTLHSQAFLAQNSMNDSCLFTETHPEKTTKGYCVQLVTPTTCFATGENLQRQLTDSFISRFRDTSEEIPRKLLYSLSFVSR